MMTFKENLIDLFSANLWATEALFNIIPDRNMDIEIESSFNTIRKTWFHIWDANVIWMKRLNGESFVQASNNFNGTNEDLKLAICQSLQDFIDYLNKIEDSDLMLDLTYSNIKGVDFKQPILFILNQLTHHNIFHRGQIITMLRNSGFSGEIPQTDVIAWYRLFKV